MLDDASTPLAIRITRPYASEDEYLDRELGTITRAGITLIGAQPRPEGAVLRFELVLSSGIVLLRGEGRVVGFKPDAYEGVGGVTLRFTRLDARSKILVDKVAARREKRRSSAPPTTTARAAVPAAPPTPPSAETLLPTASAGQREELLGRLRARAKVLDADAVSRILDGRRRA